MRRAAKQRPGSVPIPPFCQTTVSRCFGANGVEFNKAGDAMFVCNTAMDWIVKIPVTGGTPGTPVVFTNSINGCDGLAR